MFVSLKRMLARLPAWGIAATATLTLAGCGGGGGGSSTPPPPAATLTSIAVTPATATIALNATPVQLSVTGTYSDGSTKDVTSSATYSSPSGIATVSPTGAVTPHLAGTTTVTATYGGKTATMSVTVSGPTLASIAVTPASINLIATTGSQQLTVTGTYSDGTTKNLTGSATYVVSASSAVGVATVSGGGLVTAGATAGTVTITATDGGKSASSSVTVTLPTLTSITVSPSAASVNLNSTQQLIVTGHYSNGTTATLPASAEAFVSSNSTAATVSAGGLVSVASFSSTPVTVTVTNTATNLSGTAVITPSAPSNSGYVFLNDFATGVSVVDNNQPKVASVDVTTLHNNRASLKLVIPAAATSIALVSSTPQNLTGFNAISFWARVETSLPAGNGVELLGIGANEQDPFVAEVFGSNVTTTWQQFTVPMPDSTRASTITGLFHVSETSNAYTLWLSDIQYVSANVTPNVAGVTISVPQGTTLSVTGNGHSITEGIGLGTVPFATPTLLLQAGSLNQESFVGAGWFTLTAAPAGQVLLSQGGTITAKLQGTPTVTAMFGNTTISSAIVTVVQ